MHVIVHGKVRAYEPQGSYQVYVDDHAGRRRRPAPAVRGAAPEAGRGGPVRRGRKRPLPRFPRRIGVVTSPVGAVWRDIGNVMRRRYPIGRAGAVAHHRAGADRLGRDRARAASRCTPSRGSTSSSWRAAAARSRTCGRSTTSGSCAPSSRRRCRWWWASATSRTSHWPTSRPISGRRPPPRPPSRRSRTSPVPGHPGSAARPRLGGDDQRPGRSRRFLGQEGRALTRLLPDTAAARQRAAELVDRGHRALRRPRRPRASLAAAPGRFAARALAGRHPRAWLRGGAARRRHDRARPGPGHAVVSRLRWSWRAVRSRPAWRRPPGRRGGAAMTEPRRRRGPRRAAIRRAGRRAAADRPGARGGQPAPRGEHRPLPRGLRLHAAAELRLREAELTIASWAAA